MATHKTTGHVCESCNKPGHTKAQCWSAHPELVPEALLKKSSKPCQQQSGRGDKQPIMSAPIITFRVWPSPTGDLIWPWCSGAQLGPAYPRRRQDNHRSKHGDDESTLHLHLLLPWLTPLQTQLIPCSLHKRNKTILLDFKATNTHSRDNFRNHSRMAYLHPAWSQGHRICNSHQPTRFQRRHSEMGRS